MTVPQRVSEGTEMVVELTWRMAEARRPEFPNPTTIAALMEWPAKATTRPTKDVFDDIFNNRG